MSWSTLYFGDNLTLLREAIPAAAVDLIYLDPPFNSKRDHNLLFKTPKGHDCDAQITAFEDSWRWGLPSDDGFDCFVTHFPVVALGRYIKAAPHRS